MTSSSQATSHQTVQTQPNRLLVKNLLEKNLLIKNLGKQDYVSCYEQMQATIATRITKKKQQSQQSQSQQPQNQPQHSQQTATGKAVKAKHPHSTPDELWLVEHPSVYTLGQAGDPAHILNAHNTPIIKTDRGGQVTWHGEGQLVAYFLFDLLALGCNVRQLVSMAETCICELLTPYLPENLHAKPRKDAPGVYIFENNHQLGKIASLGFKIKRGFSYHGIAINIHCDMQHFSRINPCGYAGMTMLNLADISNKAVQLATLQYQFTNLLKKQHENLCLL